MIKNLLSAAVIILASVFTFSVNASDYGPVAAKETLWNIASRNRPSYDVTTQQMMLAIRRANPNAFKTSNINSLKAGSILHIPNLAEIDRANKSTALHSAKQQNKKWQTSQKNVSTSKKTRSRSSRSGSKSSSYKRYYKASQRELKKLQKRLKREKRKVRKLRHELAQNGVNVDNSKSHPSTGVSGNIAALQDEVKELEKTIEEKNVHISQLNNMKSVATETIKKQAIINETYFNRLNAIDPDFVKAQGVAASGSLKLQGIDSPAVAQAATNASASLSGATSKQATTSKDNGFVIVIAVLSLLFAIALLWRVYTQQLAKKQALKRDENQPNEPYIDKKDADSITNRTEPLLNT